MGKPKSNQNGMQDRRNNGQRLLLEDPLEGNVTTGRQITEWMANVKDGTGMRHEDIVRLVQDREQWRIMTANLLEENCTDNDDVEKR